MLKELKEIKPEGKQQCVEMHALKQVIIDFNALPYLSVTY